MAVIALGGRSWELAPLPWRACKAIHPALARFVVGAGGQGAVNALRLTEEDLDGLAGAVYLAIATVEPALTRDEFEDLAFGPADLVKCFRPVAIAAGLVPTEAAEGDAPLASPSTGPG